MNATIDRLSRQILHSLRQSARLNLADSPIVQLIDLADRVCLDERVASYIVHIVTATRSNPDIKLGSSPRGSISLYALAKAYALYQGRNYVIPDDVKYLAPYVLGHRIMLTHTAKTEKKNPADIISNILSAIVVPVA